MYDWKVAQRVKGEGYEIVFIDMTSQSWLSPREVDRTEWKHWLIVVRPEKAQSNSAFLFIGGGSNRKGMPKGPDKVAVEVARATGTVVAELRTVPNQPLEFGHDGEERSEDNLIAYAWKRFIETGDDRWLPRFPMVKSAVRAMDTIQAFFAKEDAAHPIEKFVVAGVEARLDDLAHRSRSPRERHRPDRHRHPQHAEVDGPSLRSVRILGAGDRRL